MGTHRAVTLVAAFAIAAPAAVPAADRIQPGLWEVSATVASPGVPSPAPTVQTECLSQSDVDEGPLAGVDKGACRATDVRRSGDKVTWKLDCGQLGTGEGEVVYRSGTEYEGWMRLETGGTSVRTTIHARRLRAC